MAKLEHKQFNWMVCWRTKRNPGMQERHFPNAVKAKNFFFEMQDKVDAPKSPVYMVGMVENYSNLTKMRS